MEYDLFTFICFALFGLIFGSFCNVLIYRLPNGKSLIKPNSFCPNCETPIKPYENIPVISYLILKGKCSNCQEPISPRYPIIELVCAGLWVWPLYMGLEFAAAIIIALLSTALLAVFVIDFEHKIIPDQIVIAIIVLSVPAFFLDASVAWYNRLIGFLVGGGVLLALAIFSEKALNKEGMGGGDIKLMAACGLLLGWDKILVSLFAGALVSLIAVLVTTPLKKKFPIGEQIPFGPSLAAGILLTYYYGNYAIEWYMRNITGSIV